MGNVAGVSHDEWPRQAYHAQPVRVTFNYDLSRVMLGTIVRDDLDPPWETIIRLDDGRYVRGVECQYSAFGDLPQREQPQGLPNEASA